MIKIERQHLINYIKDNIDTCLNSIDVELNLDTRGETQDGNILVFPHIEATIKIDYDNLVDYTMKQQQKMAKGRLDS